MNIDPQYLDVLIECLNDIYDEKELTSLESSVLESTNHKPKIAVGQVWLVDYPFLDFKGGHKTRRAIIFKNAYGEMAALMCSSIHGKDKKILNHPYNIRITDYKSQGFTKEVFIAGCTLLPLKYVKLIKYMGDVNQQTLGLCKQAISFAEAYKFKEPFALMNWLKNYIVGETSHSSGNNNANKIQTIYDVIRSRRVNCMDTANLIHSLCRANNIQHVIVWIRYKINENKTQGHVYGVYKLRNKSKCFRFMPLNPPQGQLVDHGLSFDKTIERENEIFTQMMKGKFGDKGEIITVIISEKELNTWDTCVAKGMTQAEVLTEVTKVNLPQWEKKTSYKESGLKKMKNLNESYESVIEMASNFKIITIDKSSVNKYKDKYFGIRHLRFPPEFPDYSGKMIIDKSNDEVVGLINIDKSRDFIQALEVSKKYQRQGIATELLKLAISMGARNLTVRNNNEPAKALYVKNGWKYDKSRNTEKMLWMTHESYEPTMESDDETKPFYFYHVVPKTADVRKGLLAPYAASKNGDKELLAAMLDKYRNRMVNGWKYYPNRDPQSLTTDELMDGLNRFRGKDGDKCIYFFRYAPYPGLGKNMAYTLKYKNIYRININDPELQKHIIRIEWGWPHSNNDEEPLTKEYYLNVTKKEYFSEYEDNPKPGQPPFAPISHIGIAFKNGICPAKFLEKVDPSKKSFLNESFQEMLTADTGEEIYYESLLHRATESVSPFSKDSNLFLSEDDIYCNFWDFENNRTHYCFVIGFSGSGKTNLARNLAKKYRAEWVSLDVLLYDSRVHRMTERFVSGMQKQRLLAKYLKETNTDLSYMKDVVYKETPEARRVMVETGRKFVDWLIHKNKEPVIIEGLDLIDIIPTDPSLYSAPIVFKGTSRLLSMFRRLQRSKFKTPLAVVMRMFSWYKTDAHGIDYLRSIVIGDYNYQYRPEPGAYDPGHQYRNTYN